MGGLLGDIGTIEWSRRTRGVLGGGERARFTAAVVLETSRVLPRLLASRGGRGCSGPDPSTVTPPDTPFAKDVVAACAELEPTVIEHSYRSYIFGRALGQVDGIECDEEALFAATMFHDIAFPEIEEIDDRCFTLAGAETAEGVLATSPLSEAARHEVLDAITSHLNPRVPLEQGPVQHLTHDGVIVDVVGIRNWELDRAGIERTFENHPRHSFNIRGAEGLRANAKRVRGCRCAALFAAGFGPALKLSPWYPLDRDSA